MNVAKCFTRRLSLPAAAAQKQTTNYSLITPLFQTNTDSEPMDRNLYEMDCTGLNMFEGNDAIIEEMKQKFHDIGVVYLKNTGLESLHDMRFWANHLLNANSIYEGGANPRKPIEGNIYDVGAPTKAWLHFHHEMAYLATSPRALSLFCAKTPESKGWTYLSDNVKATDELLESPFGQKLKNLNVCYVRNLTDKEHHSKNHDQSMIYNHWQDSFGTDKPEDAVKIAESRGLKTSWEVRNSGERFLKTRFYVSAFEYFPQMDRNLLYSSVADDFMWFDTWPGIDVIPPDERPLRLTFGDDSEMSQEEKQEFVDIYDKYGWPIKWNVGDIVIFCNYRFAHGRPGFSMDEGESRELGVLIGDTFTRMGHIEGKF